MATNFDLGDIVQLKSGGPAMTVAEKSKTTKDEYICVWFKGASKERGVFQSDILKIYESPKK